MKCINNYSHIPFCRNGRLITESEFCIFEKFLVYMFFPIKSESVQACVRYFFSFTTSS